MRGGLHIALTHVTVYVRPVRVSINGLGHLTNYLGRLGSQLVISRRSEAAASLLHVRSHFSPTPLSHAHKHTHIYTYRYMYTHIYCWQEVLRIYT